ncbi:MAG: cytoskeleton protein RodZ [Patiriisocius sp.]|jgi:cytoskeleton protein RodZ
MSDMAGAGTDTHLTASQVLREAREGMGFSQEQVAHELYLTPNYIRLIDSDEIDKIAKQAFVRGYLRSYAKMVKVDDDDVVARFEISQGAKPQKTLVRGVTREALGSTNFTGPVIQTGILGLVGLIIIISLVWSLSSGEDESEVVVTSPGSSVVGASSGTLEDENVSVSLLEETEPYGAPVSEPATDAAIDALNSVENDSEASSESSSQEATPSASTLLLTSADEQSIVDNVQESASEVEVTSPAVSENQISIQRLDGVVRVMANGEDELRFLFTDECWVKIEDGNGTSIYGDLNRAGDELVVAGIAPFEVLIGKAPAVTLEFNGRPIDLGPHTTAVDTAKVKVGN